MIRDDNFITIQGWMCTKLKLKGNALLTYALIYGFCQDGESDFHGSLNYICEFTNSTRQGVSKTLTELVESGLVIKEQGYPNNRYKINWKALDEPKTDPEPVQEDVNKVNTDVNKVYADVNKVYVPCKQSLHNNKYNNKEYNKEYNNALQEPKASESSSSGKESVIKENIYLKARTEAAEVGEIVDEMNRVWNTSFKKTTALTKKMIKDRLKEGFTKEDFFAVIADRYEKWGRKPFKFSNGELSSTYLRPSTVFSPKMENYLVGARALKVQNATSSERSSERSSLVF